ncbi:unnamed protein product, partial [Rotaria sordida]
EICKYGSQRTICDIIRSSDFLSGLFDIDRRTILKQMSTNSTTMGNCSSSINYGKSGRRALSCSTTPTNTNSTDLLLGMIEKRLDFKYRFLCNSIGYPNILIDEESTNETNNNNTKTQIHKMHHQYRQYVHQWICIVNDLITCNHTIKYKRSVLFYKLDAKFLRGNQLKLASTKPGAAELGTVLYT